STSLGWAVPLILLAPLVALAMMVSGMRYRRGAANLAEMALLASGVGVGLDAWARWKQTSPYVAAYQWINIPVAFVGPEQFQGFGIDESIRLDHIALLFLASLLLLALLVITWHRVAGRAEPGPIRFFSLVLLQVFGAAGGTRALDRGLDPAPALRRLAPAAGDLGLRRARRGTRGGGAGPAGAGRAPVLAGRQRHPAGGRAGRLRRLGRGAARDRDLAG